MPRGKTIPILRSQLAEEAKANDKLIDELRHVRASNDRLREERDFFKKIATCLMEVIRAKHS